MRLPCFFIILKLHKILPQWYNEKAELIYNLQRSADCDMNRSILIVDDEKEIADLLEVYLKNDVL